MLPLHCCQVSALVSYPFNKHNSLPTASRTTCRGWAAHRQTPFKALPALATMGVRRRTASGTYIDGWTQIENTATFSLSAPQWNRTPEHQSGECAQSARDGWTSPVCLACGCPCRQPAAAADQSAADY
jgi:hypothetical protein